MNSVEHSHHAVIIFNLNNPPEKKKRWGFFIAQVGLSGFVEVQV